MDRLFKLYIDEFVKSRIYQVILCKYRHVMSDDWKAMPRHARRQVRERFFSPPVLCVLCELCGYICLHTYCGIRMIPCSVTATVFKQGSIS